MSDPLAANIAEDETGDRRPPVSNRERARRSTPPGSLWFAATAAAIGVVVSLCAGLGTIYVPQLWPAAAGTTPPPPALSSTWPLSGSPTRSTTATPTVPSGPPTGFYRHTGPQGLVTVLPDSFVPGSGKVKGTLVAKDPADPDVEVRFGGDQQGPDSLLETITSAANAEAASPEYTRVALTSTTHQGLPAVEWEFVKPNANGAVRHTRAHYWRANGVEYVLLVTAPPARFPDAAPILAAMTRYSETP
ncbi:hypothetical protein ACFFQW_47370 [Umezawaea endophytica]|uniref:Uncharacterized protein n=1 Tax=Umezawaea endophytica TaxID=1654476 RepID=A0A9X2VJL6_9PSEU|nr:hypothetical protein [Umezawaea endophytica]MCS7477761.1 hypothetical protein [Umezawaea endophytica]